MQYTYLEIEVEVETSENNWTSQTTDADSHPMLYYKIFSITQATKRSRLGREQSPKLPKDCYNCTTVAHFSIVW